MYRLYSVTYDNTITEGTMKHCQKMKKEIEESNRFLGMKEKLVIKKRDPRVKVLKPVKLKR